MRRGFGKTYPLLIGGEEVRTDASTESRNPARPSEIVGRVATGDRKYAEKAVEKARKCLEHMVENSS